MPVQQQEDSLSQEWLLGVETGGLVGPREAFGKRDPPNSFSLSWREGLWAICRDFPLYLHSLASERKPGISGDKHKPVQCWTELGFLQLGLPQEEEGCVEPSGWWSPKPGHSTG